MSDHFFNAYELLAVPSNATSVEIKRAYKRKAQEFHPDKYNNSHPANTLFKLIVRARDILLNPKSRLEHDYAIGVRKKPVAPDPDPVILTETKYETDWGTLIGAGLLGVAVGAALRGRKSAKKKRKK